MTARINARHSVYYHNFLSFKKPFWIRIDRNERFKRISSRQAIGMVVSSERYDLHFSELKEKGETTIEYRRFGSTPHSISITITKHLYTDTRKKEIEREFQNL